MSEDKLALVTGGAGFIGSHLVRALLERGVRVRVLDNLSSGSRSNLAELDVELVTDDIGDRDQVGAAMEGVSWVFHLAAQVSVPHSFNDPRGCYATNLQGTLNVLHAAIDHGVQRVVLASSAAVYGDVNRTVSEGDVTNPLSPYAASKLAMEKAAELLHTTQGLPTVSLRLFNVYGPQQSVDSAYSAVIPAFIAAGLAGEPPTIHGDGSQQRDFVYVGDAARAFMLAAEREQAIGRVLNIASGVPLGIEALARILQEQMGRERVPIYAPERKGDISFSHAEINAAKGSLGFEPKIEIQEGLKSTVEWFRQSQHLGIT